MKMLPFAVVLVLLPCAVTAECGVQKDVRVEEIADNRFHKSITPFLKTHCLRCHGPEDEQGRFRVDRDLTDDLANVATLAKWNEVINVLNSHQMPPADEPQPTVSEVAVVVDWAVEQAADAELQKRESRLVMRRLNRNEYRNVIRDLTGIEFDVSHFPQDPSAGGFDNNGSALNLSPMQMELYYDAANTILEKSLVGGKQPPSLRWRVEPQSGDSDSNRVELDGQRPIVNGGQNPVRDGCRVIHHASWDKSISFRDFSVPASGTYRIRIKAGSLIPDRKAVIQGAEIFLSKQEEKDLAERPQHEQYIRDHFATIRKHFQTDNIYDYGPSRLKVTLSLGGQPEVISEFDVDATATDRKVFEIDTEFSTEKAGLTIEYAYEIPQELENFAFQSAPEFARPEAWVEWIELEGPLHDVWPPRSTQMILLDDKTHNVTDRSHAVVVLRSFMTRAFRRPPTDEELNDKLAIFDDAAREADSFLTAIRKPLAAVLVSPQFLFLAETTERGQPLNDFELASRLSFFLWNGLPDDALNSLAAAGTLHHSKTLTAELDRMLADPRSDAFVQSFAEQWLGLREIGANPPAEDLYRRYDRHLEVSMRQEALAFFRELLQNDLSVLNFVSSDFVVINERLARFYGISGVRGDHFRRVEIPAEVHRGGIMSQASFLTITSNGTRTSPVKRGTWILKNVLGTDPGLPVANAGEIAPVVPGIDKATVRQRLEIHRSLPQCARCHSKIDPLGLALENFDASGAYREREGFGYKGRIERDDPLIDSSSQLPDGRRIDGLDGLKAAIMEDRQMFLKCLTSKLLTYALGRELTLGDQKVVNQTVAQLNPKEPTLREILRSIVTSPLFLQR